MFTLSTITHNKSLILGPFIWNGLACYLEAVMCAQLSLIMSSMLRYSNPPRVASQLVSEASLGGDRLDNGVQLSSCSLSPNNTLSPIPLCPLIITLAISMRSLLRCGNDHQGRRLAGKSVGEWVSGWGGGEPVSLSGSHHCPLHKLRLSWASFLTCTRWHSSAMTNVMRDRDRAGYKEIHGHPNRSTPLERGGIGLAGSD